MRRILPFFYVLIIVLQGCAPGASGIVGTSYHNMTAHYNGYFYAKERIKEIENEVNDRYEWNYNRILPIFAPFDTTVSNSLSTQIEDCIKKASIAIQQHPGSKWEDDSYIIVGRARFYGSEFQDAVETFKYVNTNSKDKDTRHRALVYLLRTFVEANEMKNAVAVSDYLEREDLSRENQKGLYLNRAYLYQVRGDYNELVKNLVKADERMSNSKERSRIDFIIGQVYQHLGFDANAYDYYRESLKNSPSYELSFFTKLNMAQVTQLKKSSSVKKVRKYFRKLLKDPKNEDYKDRIYYEMGEFSLKQGKLDEAIGHYKSSVQASQSNQRQKAYAYLKLGRIYYDSLKDFSLAKNYYDSTVSILPKDEPGYNQIQTRQEVLGEFVKNLTIVQENDSILQLTRLPKDSLEAFIEAEVIKLESAEEERKKAEKERKKREARGTTTTYVASLDNNAPKISGELTGTWYFYNSTEVSQGRSAFLTQWGERPLEDNWRRSGKTENFDTEEIVEESTAVTKNTEDVQEEEGFNRDSEKQKLMNQIPTDSAEIATLETEIETAYYNLGNIYNFKLEEKENAINSFNSLLERFPNSEYKPEVLYQLYLLHNQYDSLDSDPYANTLIEEYPESIYAKLIFNPNYREESKALNEKMKKVYERTYTLYDKGLYKESIALADSALTETEQTDYTDNIALVRAMSYGKMDGVYKYQYELNNFIKSYPDSELKEYAQRLVTASEEFQINLYSSSRAKYIENFEIAHYFILVYPPKSSMASTVLEDMDNFIKENGLSLKTGNIVLDENNAMILVSEFPTKRTADTFLRLLNESMSPSEKYKGEKIYPLVITKENFEILYETKDLETYLTFFDKFYL